MNPASTASTGAPPSDASQDPTTGQRVNKSPNALLYRLYLSHTLSTWNARTFEFGAVIFLASIFPGTLFYASCYALFRSAAAAALSSTVGGLVDSTWIASSYAALMSVSAVGTATSTSFVFLPVLTTPRSVLTLLSPFVPHETSLVERKCERSRHVRQTDHLLLDISELWARRAQFAFSDNVDHSC